MKGTKFPILFTTGYLLVYTVLSRVGISDVYVSAMYLMSPFFVIWMVYCVLRYGEESEKKFDDGHWYEDSGYKANSDTD